MKKALIIGGGFAGCAAAHQLELLGGWDTTKGVIIKMNSDKTSVFSGGGRTDYGIWTFDEGNMVLCLGENASELDCVPIISIDEDKLCIEERGEISCLNKVK